MNYYIRTTDNFYPCTENSIRAENPNTSFSTPFKALDEYSLVFPSPQPSYDPVSEVVQETTPELTSKGTYEQRWEVKPKYSTQEALQGAIAADQAQRTTLFIQSVVEAVQASLDAFAKSRNYDGILSACTYATSAIPKFQTEGQDAVNARDNTWATCYSILGDVQSGNRPMPSLEGILAELPVLAWSA